MPRGRPKGKSKKTVLTEAIKANEALPSSEVVKLTGEPEKKKGWNIPNRKEIEWTPDKVNMISALYLNGYSDADVAKLIPCGVTTLQIRIAEHPEVKVQLAEAKKVAIANATVALQKIATGYYDNEVTYGTEMKMRNELRKLFDTMIGYCPQELQEAFTQKAEDLLAEGEVVKTVKKWYPPNKDAINKLLEVHQGEIWDLEAKRKAIPDVKINVTLDGKKMRNRNVVTPDYELIK